MNTNKTLTRQDLVKELENTYDYPNLNLLREGIKKDIKDNNLVIIFGASDDLIELEGAISDELSAYEGLDFFFPNKNTVKEFISSENDGTKEENVIKALFDTEDENFSSIIPLWQFRTKLPHSKFTIKYEEGGISQGIVIDLDEIIK